MGWNTTKLMVVGSLAVLYFLIWAPNAFFMATSGSMLGGFVDMIIFATINILTALIVREFGAATLRGTISLIFTRVLPSGIPFIIWLPVVVIRGLAVDTLFLFSGENDRRLSLIAGFVDNLIFGLLMAASVFLFKIFPNLSVPDSLLNPSIFFLLVSVIALVGVLDGFLAYKIYKKLENTTVVRRIQGGEIE